MLLNGAPRAGKTSIAKALQEIAAEQEQIWLNIGVDCYMKSIPARFLPGIGLRPGGERPDMEEMVYGMYIALYRTIAINAKQGFNVVADVGHHDNYATITDLYTACLVELDGIKVYTVGVDCDIEGIVRRRKATGYPAVDENGDILPPILRWQEYIHKGKQYDIMVNTSLCSPEQCAMEIFSAVNKTR